MKEKIKIQKGFIHLPILIGILIFSIVATISAIEVVKHKEEIKSVVANISEFIPSKIIEIGEIAKERVEENEVVEDVPESNQPNQEPKKPKLITEKEREKEKAKPAQPNSQDPCNNLSHTIPCFYIYEEGTSFYNFCEPCYSEEKKLEAKRLKQEKEKLKLCNGKYYSGDCPAGSSFYCPPDAKPVCCPADTVYCNGKCWAPCKAGEIWECRPTGSVCWIVESNKERQQKEITKQEPKKEEQSNQSFLAEIEQYLKQIDEQFEAIKKERQQLYDECQKKYEAKMEEAQKIENSPIVVECSKNLMVCMSGEKSHQWGLAQIELTSLYKQAKVITDSCSLSLGIPLRTQNYTYQHYRITPKLGGGYDIYNTNDYNEHYEVVPNIAGGYDFYRWP